MQVLFPLVSADSVLGLAHATAFSAQIWLPSLSTVAKKPALHWHPHFPDAHSWLACAGHAGHAEPVLADVLRTSTHAHTDATLRFRIATEAVVLTPRTEVRPEQKEESAGGGGAKEWINTLVLLVCVLCGRCARRVADGRGRAGAGALTEDGQDRRENVEIDERVTRGEDVGRKVQDAGQDGRAG